MSENTLPVRAYYRARFRGPKPREGWIAADYSRIEVEVEVYPETRTRWRARVIPTRGELRVISQTPDQAKAQVAALYEERLSDWKAFDFAGGGRRPARNIPELMTHLASKASGDQPLPRQEQVRSACGKEIRRLQVVELGMEIRCGQCKLIAEQDSAGTPTEPRALQSHIANAVQAFIEHRWNSVPQFHIGDLRKYVAEKVKGKIAPSSPDRVLMTLRAEGVVAYEVINESQRLYEVTASEQYASADGSPPDDGSEG